MPRKSPKIEPKTDGARPTTVRIPRPRRAVPPTHAMTIFFIWYLGAGTTCWGGIFAPGRSADLFSASFFFAARADGRCPRGLDPSLEDGRRKKGASARRGFFFRRPSPIGHGTRRRAPGFFLKKDERARPLLQHVHERGRLYTALLHARTDAGLYSHGPI